MNIESLNKRQLVDIVKHITGTGHDYARQSIQSYRERVAQLEASDVKEAIDWLRITLP